MAIGDLDHSGTVTNADLQGLLDLLKSGGGSTTAVPEPALLALIAPALVIGCAIQFARRRRVKFPQARCQFATLPREYRLPSRRFQHAHARQ